jgi:putative glycosyl hydrolase-like family 15 (GHL15) protein
MPHVFTRLALVSGASLVVTGLAATAPAATMGAQLTAAQTAAETSTTTTSPVLLYAQDWTNAPATRTTAQWQQVALTHSILVGSPGAVYGNMIPQLHAWNPSVKVLVYDLGPYTTGGSAEYTSLMASHPDYFARDAAGNLITVKAASGSPAFSNNYLMDEASPGWQAEEASRVLTNINKYGWDGAYIDSMGPGPFSGTTTGVPINPATGVAFTKLSWMQAAGQTLSVIKAAIGSKYLFSTGLVNGAEFTTLTHYITDSTANGGQTDSWLRVASNSPTLYPNAKTVAADLAMVQTLNAQGSSFFAWTKVWTSATQAQESAWNTYALAAYLLVDNGVSDYYLFSAPSSSADRATIYFPNEQAALGAATGAFTLTAGVYTRNFQNGVVTLNTNNNTATITVS